jgi:hypothetical protein
LSLIINTKHRAFTSSHGTSTAVATEPDVTTPRLVKSQDKLGKTPPSTFKIVLSYLPGSIISGFVSFFLFISVESLKNYSKSQKNHKIENLILLDST